MEKRHFLFYGFGKTFSLLLVSHRETNAKGQPYKPPATPLTLTKIFEEDGVGLSLIHICLGAEIVSFELFTKAMNEATLPAHREHCLSYIVDNPELFAIRTFDPVSYTHLDVYKRQP